MPTPQVCVDSPHGVSTALEQGADRVELCSALDMGGLTPSMGLMETAVALARQRGEHPPPTVVAMIRPRPGDFAYSTLELEVMKKDIQAARLAGLAGVVFGVTIATTGEIDLAAMRSLIEAAKAPHPEGTSSSFSVTLHRAIDLAPDPAATLQSLLKEFPPGSIDRVLTSGGLSSAWEGRATISRMVEFAAGSSVAILAGAGVNAGNVSELVAATGVTEVHASCGSNSSNSVEARGPAMETVRKKSVAFGFLGRGEEGPRKTDEAKIKALATIVHAL